MAPRNNGWVWIIQASMIAVTVIVLCLRRTPKGKRLEAGFFIGLTSCCLGMGISYCANAALCRPARHYPAVIVDSHKADGKRLEAGFFIGLTSCCLGMGISYCANAALCRPARHYPAVIVDSHKADPNTKGDTYTLTVLLDDGSEEKLDVFDSVYEMAMNGEPLEVCHCESYLGMEMLKLHPPKQ